MLQALHCLALTGIHSLLLAPVLTMLEQPLQRP